MKRIYIYCEGQTEESFVNKVPAPYFLNMGTYIYPIICTTKRTKSQKYKGGVTTYQKIKEELTIICRQHKNEYVTTMFDYYGMPNDTPMIMHLEPDIYRQINIIENAINNDIGQPNCIFNLMLHEFESILFSEPESFKSITSTDEKLHQIKEIRGAFSTPEHINNSSMTAPSKRIKKIIPHYSKIRNGVILSENIGIDKIMSECIHFRQWIEKIKIL